MRNLWLELPPGPKDKFPDEIHVIVEIPKGASNKYEMNLEHGIIILDRSLHTSVVYPGDYGIIPQTLEEDNDAVDVLLITIKPSFPYCVIEAVPIGVLCMYDEEGKDFKILAVPSKEPRLSNIRNISDAPESELKEIEHFFLHYKDLEEQKWVEIKGWGDKEEAKEIITEAHNRFRRIFKK